ncbi:MAG: exodeoxyribonuclease VII large subunit [Saprospiraceae bacterium]|nr:exodeoxyribonuclease VII large subunit [Saprospiraceae bacterium]
MSSYTLFELNEYIKRVIALNFQEPVWIECEISGEGIKGEFITWTLFRKRKRSVTKWLPSFSGYLA